MALSFIDMLNEGIPIIFDGAIGTEIQKFDISVDDIQNKRGCNEILNITRPDIIYDIHSNYLKAGAHVIETNTFGANRLKLKDYSLENKVHEINIAATKAGRKALDEHAKAENCFLCGTMGPTGSLISSSEKSLNKISFDECVDIYTEQATALLEGDVDLLLLETMQDLLETRAAIIGIKKCFAKLNKKIPFQVQITMDTSGHMLLGSDILAFLGAVANLKPTVIGLNCSTGPKEMIPHISDLLTKAPCPVSMIPNAGMPENIDSKAVYKMKPIPFVDYLAQAVTEYGVSVVGGCCGTTPLHIQLLAERLNNKGVKKIKLNSNTCFLSTGISGIALHNVPRPFIIGERLNTQGSRKTKEFVLENNYEELYHLALEQVKKHSVLLDLCMALNERDNEAETMLSLIRYLAERIHIPFCIDSTDSTVIEAALKSCPGSLLINSINLENKGNKARKILQLSKDFGSPVIALPIDDSGMARSVEQKINLAENILDLACNEFDIPENFIFFDPLIFTLATGDKNSANAAKESLEALKIIKKQHPNLQMVMGVSNVSFGLRPKARRLLNNLMLHHAEKAGLDAAIFNPLHKDDITSYDKEQCVLAENLLFNQNENALIEYIEFFENKIKNESPQQQSSTKKASNLSPKEQLHEKILKRDKRDLTSLIKTLFCSSPEALTMKMCIM